MFWSCERNAVVIYSGYYSTGTNASAFIKQQAKIGTLSYTLLVIDWRWNCNLQSIIETVVAVVVKLGEGGDFLVLLLVVGQVDWLRVVRLMIAKNIKCGVSVLHIKYIIVTYKQVAI